MKKVKIKSNNDLPVKNDVRCLVWINGVKKEAVFCNLSERFYSYENGKAVLLENVTHYSWIVQ